MFELSIALKYLIPRKKHLSVALIAMLSTVIISLVVWLLIVFLSVTEGMEKNWLKKLTDLNAPIRITPTANYYSSYYYKIDSISNLSNFSYKTLHEKLQSPCSDPYDPDEDSEIPSYWPKKDYDSNGRPLDPVKDLVAILHQLQKQEKSLFFQDYEMSGALLKLQMLRNISPDPLYPGRESMNFLTQVSYLATVPENPKITSSLFIPPSQQDIHHLFFLAGYRLDAVSSDAQPQAHLSSENFQTKIQSLSQAIAIKKLSTISSRFQFPRTMLPEDPITVYALFHNDVPISFVIPVKSSDSFDSSWQKGSLQKKANGVIATFPGKKPLTITNEFFTLSSDLILDAQIEKQSLLAAKKLQDLSFSIQGSLQGKKIAGSLPWKNLAIQDFSVTKKESFASDHCFEATEIFLPKAFQDNGVLIGDVGFLSYTSSTTSGAQELRLPIFVSGFYDPGLFSVGNKCLFVPRQITQTINSAGSAATFDKIDVNGFQVWFDQPEKALAIKQILTQKLQEAGLSSFWKISTYREYDFAKDLLQQFQSDKYLFSLVAIIILLVACCNILSFLVLLVSDKKKEIGILQAMGASKKSIAIIFSSCGVAVGLMGCLLGICAGIITLTNIDALVRILSSLQGHEAFHQTFYGSSLPNTLSSQATLFIIIATPILSLLAGLVPAIKACKINPSTALRSES